MILLKAGAGMNVPSIFRNKKSIYQLVLFLQINKWIVKCNINFGDI